MTHLCRAAEDIQKRENTQKDVLAAFNDTIAKLEKDFCCAKVPKTFYEKFSWPKKWFKDPPPQKELVNVKFEAGEKYGQLYLKVITGDDSHDYSLIADKETSEYFVKNGLLKISINDYEKIYADVYDEVQSYINNFQLKGAFYYFGH